MEPRATMDITVLVPAYKPKYLPELLDALLAQTVRPRRVIFSDDSPDQAFLRALGDSALMARFAGWSIEAIPGPRRGAWPNFVQLLQHFDGSTEFFQFLLDDDIPYPTFYERHLHAHTHAKTDCVVSRRWDADETGHPTATLKVPTWVEQQPGRMVALTSDLLLPHTVGAFLNWLGEFSNATFRRDMRDALLDTRLAGISYAGLEDLGAFLVASGRSPLIFINEHLGYFRHSAQQNTALRDGPVFKFGLIAWMALALAGRRQGVLAPAECAAMVARVAAMVAHNYRHDPEFAQFAALGLAAAQESAGGDAEVRFVAAWHAYNGTAE